MPDQLRNRLIFHGAAVFLVGMLVGFPFAFVLLAEVNGTETFIPGTVRAWRMAHLEGALNGMLIIIAACATAHFPVSDRGTKVIYYGLVITAWGNIIASINSALTGGRGLSFNGFTANSLTYLLFMAAIFGVIAAFAVIAHAALKASKA